jgi:hypothetical protein
MKIDVHQHLGIRVESKEIRELFDYVVFKSFI